MKLSSILFMVASMLTVAVHGQTNATIENMKKQRADIEKQVSETEKLIASTDKSITAQVSNLNLVTARLEERRRLLNQTNADIRSLDAASRRLNSEYRLLQQELEDCRGRYADACRFYQCQQTSLNPFTFIFSSTSFAQLKRRTRYISEYTGSLYELGHEITEKQDSLNSKQAEIDMVKAEKVSLQAEQSRQAEAALSEQKKQAELVKQLQSKRSTLKKEMSDKQKQMNKLSAEIDKQIEKAIKEEEERRRRAAGSQQDSRLQAQKAEDLKLSGSFESNKGRLPVPITGPYLVVGKFGVQEVAGMKDVKVNNLGIDIQGQSGSKARVVFDGTVTTIFQQGKGQIGVLVRHGNYISVYCNLKSAEIKKGDALKTGDVIGPIQDEDGKTILHFQLHKENAKLNPSDWLVPR